VYARAAIVSVPAVVLPRLCYGGPVDPVVLEETRVLGGDDGFDEGRGDLRERDGPSIYRVAPALAAQPLLARADERGRRRIAPAEEDYLRKRDEDEEKKRYEEKRKIS
jgi:hypothetical protein